MLIDIESLGVDEERFLYLLNWVSLNVKNGEDLTQSVLTVLNSEVTSNAEAFVIGMMIMDIINRTVESIHGIKTNTP